MHLIVTQHWLDKNNNCSVYSLVPQENNLFDSFFVSDRYTDKPNLEYFTRRKTEDIIIIMHSVAWLDTSSLLLAIFAFLIVYITQKVLLPFGSWCKQSYVKRKALSTFPGPPNGGLFGNYKKVGIPDICCK